MSHTQTDAQQSEGSWRLRATTVCPEAKREAASRLPTNGHKATPPNVSELAGTERLREARQSWSLRSASALRGGTPKVEASPSYDTRGTERTPEHFELQSQSPNCATLRHWRSSPWKHTAEARTPIWYPCATLCVCAGQPLWSGQFSNVGSICYGLDQARVCSEVC